MVGVVDPTGTGVAGVVAAVVTVVVDVFAGVLQNLHLLIIVLMFHKILNYN